MIRFGGPLFGVDTKDPDAAAKACKELGYGAIYCPDLNPDDEAGCRDYGRAITRHGLMIAEAGVWIRLAGPNPEETRANVERAIHRLRVADLVGAQCCVDIAGSFHPTSWHGAHPANVADDMLDAAAVIARTIIDAVQPRRARFTYEMMQWTLPDSADAYLELIRAVDRKAFGVHLDPTNLINSPRRFYDTAAVIRECFEKLGPHIAACHAKDVAMDLDKAIVHLTETRIGTGNLDYQTYLECLDSLGRDVPLMMEHLRTPEDYAAAADHVRNVARTMAIELG
ncbi:MAG TPA: sugar phosphate isomerase/epimerase [Planctomycetota bacterium]|nr:sugar phosphate isomerase/epimerase [Planctomycetota bacterium]